MTAFIRPSKSNNLTIGIVGLPNTGKSTLFNYLTKNTVPAENYPFCTIDPSYGKVEINDPRINDLVNIYTPKNVVKAYLGITDIAGLVKGASENFGLGNMFLSHIRNVDAIFHVVRCFENDEIVHVEDTVDPVRDIKIVNDELRFKDIETVTKIKQKMSKEIRGKNLDKKLKDQINLIDKLLKCLEKDWVNKFVFSDDEILFISGLGLLTTKRVVYLANVCEDEYVKKRVNKHLRNLIEYIKEEEDVIRVCGDVNVEGKSGENIKSEEDVIRVSCEKGKSGNVNVEKKSGENIKSCEKEKVDSGDKGASKDIRTDNTSTSDNNKDNTKKQQPQNIIVFSALHENTTNSNITNSNIANSNTTNIHSTPQRTPFINKLVKKGYEILDLINFFTVGKDEVRAWTIKRGTCAPQAGGVIHSDFMNYFIMAEVMSYNDLKEAGSEVEVKNRGKYHQRGKMYVVNDGDIMLFKSNPPKSSKKK
ncbi:gtp-binding protein [Vairimorpha apis BRL 01]|uniref:Obg-like ATPase homolog n=1 Tax=Vairimorpha apis BRL 01 TaxID=1037528 RepID=T0L6Q5_9MICR|nr:gtp-binding protein [Vairimorpha apis BRL 01]